MNDLTNSRILIVDDDRLLLDLLSRALRDWGFDVTTAASAEEALGRMQTETPEVMLINPGIRDSESCLQGRLHVQRVLALVDNEPARAAAVRLNLAVVDKRGGLSSLKAILSASSQSTLVLVVDDDEGVRTIVSSFLERDGHRVISARTAREAAAQLNTRPDIAIVLLDVMMPEEGGIELLRDIMRKARHPQVIMISALRDREIARQAMKLGAFDYILKPIDLESLSASITVCLLRAGLQE